MNSIIKRNGAVVPFDIEKIAAAINKAFAATGEVSGITLDVTGAAIARDAAIQVDAKYPDPVGIEDIQNEVERALMRRGYDRETIYVNHCGREHILRGEQARLWLDGRFGIADAGEKPDPGLQDLIRLGLVEATDCVDAAGYRMLSNCVICLTDRSSHRLVLGRNERTVWKWLKGAGFMLRISELVKLCELGIKPEPALLGKENWHTLVDRIYSVDTIFDGILDGLMERSEVRDDTVAAVLGLLRKKRIILA